MPNCWTLLVEVLELYEYDTEAPRYGNRVRLICGVGILVVGVAGFICSALPPVAARIAFLSTVGVAVGMVAILIGLALFFSALSSAQFSRLAKTSSRVAGKVGVIVQMGFAFASLILTIFILLLFVDVDDADKSLAIAQIVILIVALATGNIVISSGPIKVGIVAQRSRFNSKKWAAIIEAITMGFPLAAAVYLVSTVSASWSALALALLLALVGYCNFKLKALDSAFSELLDHFDTVRECSLALAQVDERRREPELARQFYSSYRSLHLLMVSSPSITRRPVYLFGIHALCAIADARTTHAAKIDDYLKGDKRIEASQKCLEMPEAEFAMASAQIFDGLMRMLDSSFAPGFKRSRRNTDIRDCLDDFALPVPGA